MSAAASPGPNATLLLADVGGTNCRLAIADAASGVFLHRLTVSTDEAPSPQDAIARFVSGAGAAMPKRAALALAGPAADDTVKLTNSDWVFDRAAIRAALGFDTLLFANDLEAQARAVLDLDAGAFHRIGAPAAPPLPEVVSVVGPGTGLGVAVLEPSDRVRVRATEGGHVGFAPYDDLDRALLDWLRGRFGAASNEHVVSGPGFARLYTFMAERAGAEAGDIDGPEITKRALSGDALARQTVERYAALLGGVCGDIVLAQGGRALVLVGGIANALAPILTEGGFRARFDQRGPHPGFLDRTPCLVATADDLGLKGARLLLLDAAR
ncbi:MAG: ROK family protein [Hyphomonadaceae bacterium]